MKCLLRSAIVAAFALAVTHGLHSQTAKDTPLSAPTAYQQAIPVKSTWDPMLDEQMALPPTARNLTTDQVVFPQYSKTANPNFGGFRVAPSTPAHSPGDTSRNLASVGADFNHDGCEDIVSFQNSTLTLMAGDCKGNFTRVSSQPTATAVYHAVEVDINHDGYPDIIAMTYPYSYSGTVVALLNQKNGTFSAPVVIAKKASVFSGLQAMSVYDVNGDGNPDVVISGFGTVDSMTNSNLVFEVVTGNADGTFNPQIETLGTYVGKPTFGFDNAAAIRVINGQMYYYAIVEQSSRVDGVSFGSEALCRWPIAANGTVDVAHVQITGLPFASVAPNKYLNFADLNNDGIPDLTIMDGDGELHTALGASDGSFGPFQTALPIANSNLAAEILFQDVDGDGTVDAIIAGAAYVAIYPGNGDGTFRAPKVTYLPGYAFNGTQGLTFPVSNHVIFDFDGDGTPDVAFFDTPKRAISFLKGKPDGTFIAAPALVSASGDFPTEALLILATPDLNGDGIKDVIVSTAYGILGGIADGKGNYTFHQLSSVLGITSVSTASADFNKDGREDVIFTANDSAGYPHLYLGLSNGDGTVMAVPQTLPYTSTAAPGVAVGDINGDGVPDLVIAANINSPTPATYTVYPMINDGKGHLTAGTPISLPSSIYAIALQDMNGDGKADLLLSYGSYSLTTTSLFLANASGGFAASPSTIIQNSLPAGAILAKDVTGDGIPDVVLTITNGASEGLTMYVGNGDGTFSSGLPLVTGVVPSFTGVADLNGDGYPDIFFSNSENVLTDANDGYFGLVVLPGAGNNTFGTPRHYNIYGASSPIFPVDLYSNGTLSLFARSGNNGTTILANTGGTSLTLVSSKTSWPSTDTSSVTVQVSPMYNDQALPSGYVNLYVDGKVTNRLSLAANGAAVFTLSGLSAGTHILTASYEGDTNYNSNAKSNQVTITVVKAAPSFTLSSSASSLSIAQTGSATASLTVQANAAFSGPVSLACSGAPADTTCSFSQASVFLAPGQVVASSVTIASSAHAMNTLPAPLGGGVFLCGLLLCLPMLRRKAGRRAALTVVICLAAFTQLTGCSGGGSTPAINPGAYPLTITATPGDPTAAAQIVNLVVNVSK